MPGVDPEQIKIGLTNSRLKIWGEKKRRVSRNRVISHLCSERSYGRFSRIVPLRWSISGRNTTAELANGILLIRMPKVQDRRGTEIIIPVKDSRGE